MARSDLWSLASIMRLCLVTLAFSSTNDNLGIRPLAYIGLLSSRVYGHSRFMKMSFCILFDSKETRDEGVPDSVYILYDSGEPKQQQCHEHTR
ncbi:hypothetical protein M426DRAFT_321135 [Hypoxylon sp. CI-4A]|nr:hypothetical protein M426DRAFT_321135 [Hypoxylon sp. CI-4A]